MLTARSGWRTSTFSSNGDDCFEVEPVGREVRLRHSKHPAGPVVTFTLHQWAQWIAEACADELDNRNGAVRVITGPAGWTVKSLTDGAVLRFDNGEVTAFLRGVHAGEFDIDTAAESAAVVVVAAAAAC